MLCPSYINEFKLTILLTLVSSVKKCGGETVNDIMTTFADNSDTLPVPVQEVEHSKTVILLCRSNDNDHLFMFWQLPKDDIVGPTNKYDTFKYDYEIVSGNLTIRQVTKEEEGIYHCVSRGVRNNDINIRAVRMVVKGDNASSSTSEKNYFRAVVVLGTIFLITGCVYIVYRLINRRHKKDLLLEMDSDDEDSVEEIYRAPGTSREFVNIDFNKIDDVDEDDSVETQKISTDFEDILQNSHK